MVVYWPGTQCGAHSFDHTRAHANLESLQSSSSRAMTLELLDPVLLSDVGMRVEQRGVELIADTHEPSRN